MRIRLLFLALAGPLLISIVDFQAWATDPRFATQLACVRQLINESLNLHSETPHEFHLVTDSRDEFLLPEDKMPWTAGYFAMENNGIAKRWQGKRVFEKKLLSEATPATLVKRLKNASVKELDGLAATEKLDVALDLYDFPITRTEVKMRGLGRARKPANWEGFCNGVCAASILFREPQYPVTVINKAGIRIVFQPNDIKALASASYFYVEKYAAINSPNKTEAKINLATIPNPGVFDYLLTQYLGKHNIPFVVDINPNPQIWNHVIIGYNRKLGRITPYLADPLATELAAAPNGTAFTVKVQVKAQYTENITDDASNRPTVPKLRALDVDYVVEKSYTYRLFLDENRRVIGGAWPPGTKMAPDLIWFPMGRGMDAEWGSNPYLDFDSIEKLVNASHDPNSSIQLF